MDFEHIGYLENTDCGNYLRIDRLLSNGRRVFMTEIETVAEYGNEEQMLKLFDEYSDWVGKNVCIDSPKIRKVLHLD